jgi:hypothetical protein
MRPQLHPDMGPIVISARVAVQLVTLRYRRSINQQLPSSLLATITARSIPEHIHPFVRFALHSLSVYLDMGYNGNVWLSNVLEAAHFGSSFRRCFFFAYKENRGPYPRVTNRGVLGSKEALPRRIRKGNFDA